MRSTAAAARHAGSTIERSIQQAASRRLMADLRDEESTMAGRVAGKIVVVTGAARGMGRADAEALAAEGAAVWAVDVLDDEGDAFARATPGVAYAHVDVTRQQDWDALAEQLRLRGGRLDALVNNAGVAARGRLPEVEQDEWQRAFAVNVTGPLLGMQALHPLLRSGASIVNIVSIAGLAGHAAAAYTASKWALRGLSRTAALEFGEQGIRVNAVFPGLIDTPLMAGASPRFADAAIAETPLGRSGVVTDVAPLVVFLVSDESSFMNGAEIAVDGGLTAHVSHKSIADAIRRP
jgi:3alpha(or 20beta)-hydroxysteroid dehydrogenase